MTRLDEVMRAAAPRARVRWSGAPSTAPSRQGLLAVLVLLVVATAYAVTVGLLSRTILGLREVALLSAPGLVALLVIGSWTTWLEARRTDYRITTEGVFVARGSLVLRFALPETMPVEHTAGLG